MNETIASYNVKGGVGKTSAAVNLAYLSAQDGHRTLLWDLDPQGAATFLFRIRRRSRAAAGARRRQRPMLDAVKATDFDGLDLLPADFTYRHMDIDLNERTQAGATLRDCCARWRRVRRGRARRAAEPVAGVRECPDSRGLVLAPLIPTVLSVRTSNSSAPSSTGCGAASRRRAGLLLDGRPASQPAPRDRVDLPTRTSDSASRPCRSRATSSRWPCAGSRSRFRTAQPAGAAFTQLWSEVRDLLGLASEKAGPA